MFFLRHLDGVIARLLDIKRIKGRCHSTPYNISLIVCCAIIIDGRGTLIIDQEEI